MNNLSAPVAGVRAAPYDCTVDAWIPALHAKCISSSRAWDQDRELRCSTSGNETCVQSSPRTVVNFTTGAFSACSQRAIEHNGEPRCPPGDFAVIFGQWLSSRNYEDGQNLTSFIKHTVDCRVSYGTIELEQDSLGPRLKRKSFVKSKAPIGEPGSPASLWQSRFLRESGLNYSPYTFAYTTSDLNTMSPLSRYLRPLESSPDANDTARVGQTIEANFDMATLFAFARAPQAATVHVVHPEMIYYGSYDVMVLFVLALRFLAMVSVLSTHWRVQSDDVVLGYNPVLIARRADDVLSSSFVAKVGCGEGSSVEVLSLGKVGRQQSMV
jgi:hypothetical protein